MAATGDTSAGPWMCELERSECLRLMAGAGIGRVVLSAKRIPVALPVNVAVMDEDVVFLTDPGSKLSAAVRGDVVTVEADHVDRMYHTGWSVLVTGMAQLVTDPDALRSALRVLGSSWVAKREPTVVRVLATLVSGRRIGWNAVGPTAAPSIPPWQSSLLIPKSSS